VLVPTLDQLLRDRATERPDTPWLRFRTGDLTFADVDRRVSAVAAGLAAVGVRRGDLVPVLMPNGPDIVITWFALDRLGAVPTLLNTAFRGPALVHALNLTGADLLVVDATLTGWVEAVIDELAAVRRAVVFGADVEPVEPSPLSPLEVIAAQRIERTGDEPPAPSHGVADAAMVIFTSGTTGPSKGCLLSHRYAVRHAQLMIEHFGLRADDVLYCPFPLFHLDATVLTVVPALVLGTTAAIGDRFSASGFWNDVRTFGATVFDYMGATLTMLHKRPPAPDDADNPARLGWGVPLPEFAPEFEARFGVRLVEAYGSTDAGVPIYQPLDEPRRAGSCGRAIASYDARVFDEDDVEVAPGVVGELVVRPLEPSLIADGYYGRPEATNESRRNLWFHTGDLVRRDEDGWFYYVGRRSDSIRRRGENISTFEVEEVVKMHPRVLDAAAFGVPSELTEDDVMVAVVSRPGTILDPVDLIAFCRERMARHMVPRYVDLVDKLPRTPTEKVEKAVLRERGVTPTTWDGEAAARS
jgi:crotonobetaine/carnitine-CoA ligase